MIRLFPISIRGLGTPDVESFASYVYRVAFEHGLYVGELLRFTYRHGIELIGGPEGFPVVPKSLSVAELVRPSHTTNMFVDLFGEMTCQDLRPSVLRFLNSALGRSTGEVFDGFRWCPECIGEMRSVGAQPYLKLIWHMRAVTHCPIHRTPLVDKCTVCGCCQKSYIVKRKIGFCQDCGQLLAKRSTRLRSSDIANSWHIAGSDILTLFTDLAVNPAVELPDEGVRLSLDRLFDYYWSRDREQEFYQLLSRDELLGIIHREKVVSLKVARRLAFRTGMSLYTLMSGNAHQSTGVLNSEWVCELPEAFRGESNKNKRDHQAVARKIRRELKMAEQPLSLHELAREVGVSVGYLDYRFSALAKSVVKNHKDHVEHEMLRKRYHAQASALAFFLEEKYQEQPKSRKQAYRTLREETGLPKFMLRRAIQSAYVAMQ